MAQLEEENQLLKSDCHIHATLKQRLEAVYKLRHQYDVKTLCRVLKVNRSTYYKHVFSEAAPRTCENQVIRKQEELRLCCFEYINRYNSKRPHSSLGDYTPDEIEELYMERQE